MSGIQLRDCQLDAVKRMKNGCILCGDVGSGKSRTALAYYWVRSGGKLGTKNYEKLNKKPKDLYIITTARKRDQVEWEGEMVPFLLPLYETKVVIDSWNNIKKYKLVKDSFFIFDEQRVVGKGEWSKAFIEIAKWNEWVLLSATPGDNWSDYIPVFIANGFFKNRTQFNNEHIIWSRFSKYPKIDRYFNEGKLLRLRNEILVDIDFKRQTVRHNQDILVSYDRIQERLIWRKRWNPYDNKPIETAGQLCYLIRRVVNSDESRGEAILDILKSHERLIVFYNYDYELDILRALQYPDGCVVREWNGHHHMDIPDSYSWVYLVQYTAGAEGWNCIKTDTIVFYSQNYSYKVMAQASGRIDRMNTPYKDLYFYHLKSNAPIDISIERALKEKKNFNEQAFTKGVIK